MSQKVRFYPGPNRTTIWARTRKQALAMIRAWPLDYEVYGMMYQGDTAGNFDVTAQEIRMVWWHPSDHPRNPDTIIRRRYPRKERKTP